MTGLNTTFISVSELVDRVVYGSSDTITSKELDDYAAERAAAMTHVHPDYALLAGRVSVTGIHKNTPSTFSEAVRHLFEHGSTTPGSRTIIISRRFFRLVMRHSSLLDTTIVTARDLDFTYFGLKTLEKSYLLRIDGRVVERPQYLFMRVAIGIHGEDLPRVIQTYHLTSKRYFTHASPTLFNAGTPYPQLSSCFLVAVKNDTVEGIYETVRDCAVISKHSGGIGLSVHTVRASGHMRRMGRLGSLSNGIVPMLKVFEATARHVDQGGGSRPGAIAVYIEPWHADIFDVIRLKSNHGKEEQRARGLFYALWTPDLFMRRVQSDSDWSLFCPSDAPRLHECHGSAFDSLYVSYERSGYAKRTVKARHLWDAIIESQIETGGPYMLYKDAINAKSNHRALGTIISSNLCTEIVQFSSPDEIAVCNLASVALPSFVDRATRTFKFDHLHSVVKVITLNLNRTIDNTYYPLPACERSNLRHRPIGIGVQGLADVFMALGLPFDSSEARDLNAAIFETIYHAALEASNELAQVHGPYLSWSGSPASHGQLQFDLWGVTPSGRWNWDDLKDNIRATGLRNSLLCAPMPTASTSQILGFNESVEPYTSNLYVRRVVSGEFQVVCPALVRDLVTLDLWTDSVRRAIISNRGSIQSIAVIPPDIKAVYKTAWELSQKVLIDMAVGRGPYICQSQSLNIFLSQPSAAQLTSMHFYGWEKGLKTGMYYLRTLPAAAAVPVTVDPRTLAGPVGPATTASWVDGLPDDVCVACSS